MRNNGEATDALVRAMSPRYIKRSLVPRIRKYARKRADGCIVWLGSASAGYPVISIGSGLAYVHRVLWLLVRGQLPAGVELTHKCKRPDCVNPRHLRPIAYRPHDRHSEKELDRREQSRRKMKARWSTQERRAETIESMREGWVRWRRRFPYGRED